MRGRMGLHVNKSVGILVHVRNRVVRLRVWTKIALSFIFKGFGIVSTAEHMDVSLDKFRPIIYIS